MGHSAIVWFGDVQNTADNEANRVKEAFYQKALQDLVLFKSKTNAALLQVSPQLPPPAVCISLILCPVTFS